MSVKSTSVAHAENHLDPEKTHSTKASIFSPEETAEWSQDWDEVEEKELIKKIDWRVFPMLSLVFGLSFLDRGNISAAYIAGLSVDVQLAVGSRYSIVLLVFFIGYAIFEIPSNMIIRHVGARYWISFLIIAWGTSVLGVAFVRSWISIAVCRALIGIFEAGVFPGAIFIISAWYKQYETATRVAIFYMASLFTSAIGPILAYGLSLIRVGDGIYTQGWRWIFIIEGSLTIAVGFVATFTLIEFPEKATWMNQRQRHIALARVQIDNSSREYKHPTVKESIEMLLDWKVGFYALQYYISTTCVYALGYYQPIILRNGMGFSYALSQVLSCPPYIFAIIMTLLMSWLSDKYKTRWPILVFQSLVAIIGYLIVLYTKPSGVRYFGIFLTIYGSQANVPGTLSYGQNQTARLEKKGLVSAAMISAGALGGITGSTIFRSADSPLYLPGMWTCIALQMLYLPMTVVMSMYFKKQNRLADEGRRPALEGVEGFRYAP